MSLFVQPKIDEIYCKTKNGYFYLAKDKDSVKPTWTVLLLAVVAAIIACAIIFDLGILLVLIGVAFLIWFFGEVENFRFSRYLFERRATTLYISATCYAPKIKHWDNPTVQAALEAMWDEKTLLKDQFEFMYWDNQFRSIHSALNEQAEIEKKRLLATRDRIDYAKSIKETNEILNKSLE